MSTSTPSTTTAHPLASITKQLTVAAPIDRCFRVFTEQMTTWWPPMHHIGKSPLVAVVVEPRADGRWFESCEDGSECTWGKVLLWEPPQRLVLAWQLNAQFAYDATLVTEVDIRFTVIDAKTTRVDFEHRNMDRLHGVAITGRDGMDAGWGQILESFAGVARL